MQRAVASFFTFTAGVGKGGGGDVLLLNFTVYFPRDPLALAQECPLVAGDEAEAREAGGLRVGR